MSSEKLGKLLSTITNSQASTNETAYPQETSPLIQLRPTDSLKLYGSAVFTKLWYPNDSFIIDHPVYGDIDSSTLLIDGGHLLLGSVNGTLAYYPLDTNPSSSVVIDDKEGVANDGTWTIIASGYYPFNGDANDASTSGNNGTVSGLTLATDHLGNTNNAYESTSDNNRITINAGVISGVFTFNVWLKINSYTPYTGVTGSNGLVGDGAVLNDGGRISFRGAVGESFSVTVAGGTATNITLSETMPTNTWFMLTVVRDSSDNIYLYKNASRIDTGSPTATGDINFEVLFDNPTNSTFTGLNGIGDDVLITEAALSAEEVAHLYTVTSSHKLDNPLVTRTDSNGDSITGYEFTGQASNISGSGVNWGTYAELTTLGIDGGTTCSYYGKFMLSDDLSVSGTADFIFGQRYGDGATIHIGSSSLLGWRQDDTTLDGNVTLTRGVIYQYVVSFEYDSGTPANSVWTMYVADADGNVVDTASRTGWDGFSDATYRIGADMRFGYIMRGVISKPLVLNRVLTSDERTGLFNGIYPKELILKKTN